MAEHSAIYDDVVERIQAVYNSCSRTEQMHLIKILTEISVKGYSETLERVWLADFKEVPVSIDQFICDSLYLGSVNRNGEAVYDFWKQCLRDIFNGGNRYNEIIFSGATRVGKTSTMVVIMAYMLYRLMIYRNPHEYFRKKEVSRFTIAFANLNKELAYGVAYRELNDTLKDCDWFMQHGTVSRSDRNFYYIPEGDKIDIVAGSDASNFLGMQLWCLTGNTKILTDEGVLTLAECADDVCNVMQLVNDTIVSTPAQVVLTKYVQEIIRIELEDGSVIEGTPEHRIMLADGSYKALKDLSSSDDLLTLNDVKEVDEMNLSCYDKKFVVYEHVSPKGKRYIGITSKINPEERWLHGIGYKENNHFWSAINKYGWSNFEHNILAVDLTLKEACDMEQELIRKYDTMSPEHGYNHTTGGNWSTPDQETREKLSAAVRKSRQNPDVIKKISDSLKGHAVSDETRRKISEANTGMKMNLSEEERQRRREYPRTEEARQLRRGQVAWNKGLTKETDARMKQLAENMRGRDLGPEWRAKLSETRKAQYANGYCPVWITNDKIETSIQKGQELPEGFHFGRLAVLDTYIHKGEKSKKIQHSEIEYYMSQGWELGRPSNVGDAIRKANQKFYWTYDNQRFEFTQDLVEYLRQNGYPKIVDSTITSLYNKGFQKSPTYHSLEGKIQKVML